MENRRSEPRFMCADLVRVRIQEPAGAREEVVNLEDISASGACIQLDAATLEGADVEMLCATCKLRGKVRYCRASPLGFDVGIAFDEQKSWNVKRFNPKHLLYATARTPLPLKP